eukprot:SAG22_NODE_68_length_22846_cov_32.458258_11_plen_626_part_00
MYTGSLHSCTCSKSVRSSRGGPSACVPAPWLPAARLSGGTRVATVTAMGVRASQPTSELTVAWPSSPPPRRRESTLSTASSKAVEATVAQLVEMGFGLEAAAQALTDAEGDVAAAVAMLSSAGEPAAGLPPWASQPISDSSVTGSVRRGPPPVAAGGVNAEANAVVDDGAGTAEAEKTAAAAAAAEAEAEAEAKAAAEAQAAVAADAAAAAEAATALAAEAAAVSAAEAASAAAADAAAAAEAEAEEKAKAAAKAERQEKMRAARAAKEAANAAAVAEAEAEAAEEEAQAAAAAAAAEKAAEKAAAEMAEAEQAAAEGAAAVTVVSPATAVPRSLPAKRGMASSELLAVQTARARPPPQRQPVTMHTSAMLSPGHHTNSCRVIASFADWAGRRKLSPKRLEVSADHTVATRTKIGGTGWWWAAVSEPLEANRASAVTVRLSTLRARQRPNVMVGLVPANLDLDAADPEERPGVLLWHTLNGRVHCPDRCWEATGCQLPRVPRTTQRISVIFDGPSKLVRLLADADDGAQHVLATAKGAPSGVVRFAVLLNHWNSSVQIEGGDRVVAANQRLAWAKLGHDRLIGPLSPQFDDLELLEEVANFIPISVDPVVGARCAAQQNRTKIQQ